MVDRQVGSAATFGQVYGDQIKFVDNPFFPMSPRAKEYHEQVAAKSEKEYKRYFLGEWKCLEQDTS